eukprot:6382315-Prymnesium_polylepis.1
MCIRDSTKAVCRAVQDLATRASRAKTQTFCCRARRASRSAVRGIPAGAAASRLAKSRDAVSSTAKYPLARQQP